MHFSDERDIVILLVGAHGASELHVPGQAEPNYGPRASQRRPSSSQDIDAPRQLP